MVFPVRTTPVHGKKARCGWAVAEPNPQPLRRARTLKAGGGFLATPGTGLGLCCFQQSRQGPRATLHSSQTAVTAKGMRTMLGGGLLSLWTLRLFLQRRSSWSEPWWTVDGGDVDEDTTTEHPEWADQVCTRESAACSEGLWTTDRNQVGTGHDRRDSATVAPGSELTEPEPRP